jgi:CheY-like chemotaxis protein
MASSNPNLRLPGILLIDDDAISREVLAMMLEMHGFPVDSAENGKQALEFLESTPILPGIVLMDTQMPGLSGLRLIHALRQRFQDRSKDREAGNNARIIAISGSEVSDPIRRAADGFLLKPIQVESLLALLDTANAAPDAPEQDSVDLETAEDAESSEVLNPIDPIVLGKLKAMMPAAALREVYSAVATDLEGRLSALTAAMDAQDPTEVARIAHTIKGGCGMVGLSIAQRAATRLESGNLQETWPKELLQLHFALGKLQGILENGLL